MNEKSMAKADLGMSLLKVNLQFIMVEVIENSLIKKEAGLARNGNRSCSEVVGGLEFAGGDGRSG